MSVYLDLAGSDPATIEETASFVQSAPGALVFSKLLRGFVLPLGGLDDLGRLVVHHNRPARQRIFRGPAGGCGRAGLAP